MKEANELKDLLRQHHGSEQIFKHSLNALFNYTEGVRAFAQNAGGGAYWLLDILATEPAIRQAVRDEGMCVMLLTVHKKGSPDKVQMGVQEGRPVIVTTADPQALITVSRDASTDDDTGVCTPLDVRFTRPIEYTDCPVGQWKFYLTWTQVGNKEVMLALLPSEY